MLILNGLSTEAQQQHFISHYWQKAHCCFRGALANFDDPLSADELAGLACEDSVTSRIVSGPQKKVEHGPFTEQRLQAFDSRDSTLLVQAVDHYVPELVSMRNAFGFIPDWRFEDIMVSFAVPGGGVGPHFDQYDVFLVQGEGSREWRVGQLCDAHSETDSSSGQTLLTEFQTHDVYTLHKGDMLYIPPRLAHWGTSNDNSICYSVGFRAPSGRELASEWAEALANDWHRFQDPLAWYTGQSKYRITSSAVQQAQTLLLDLIGDESRVADALGAFQSANLSMLDIEPPTWAELENQLENGVQLSRSPGARAFYYCDGSASRAYFNGHALSVSGVNIDWLERLCAADVIDNGDIRSHCMLKDDRINTRHKALLLAALQYQVYEF